MKDLERVSVPRSICLSQEEKERDVELHGFSDASEEAYGAAIYARITYQIGKVSTKLIATKTSVAPLASTSIPRIELMGAVLALRLGQNIAKAFKLHKNYVTYWTDSQNVQCWIHGKSRRLKAFVGNRVAEIQQHSDPMNWYYVPSKMNPADLVTHGLNLKQLIENNLWWNGPEFISKDSSCWPRNYDRCKSDYEEVRTKYAATYHQQQTIKKLKLLDKLNPENHSSWIKMIRLISWIKRFITNCRAKKINRTSGELLAAEIKDSEAEIICTAQQTAFAEEYKMVLKQQPISTKSALSCLRPVISEDGLLRANTRIRNAEYLPLSMRYPIIIALQK